MTSRKNTASFLLKLKIELAGIKPMIWRRVVVPEPITQARLHRVIQAVMGWKDYHLHEFEIARDHYIITCPEDSFGPPVISETRVRLGESLGDMATFRYIYDFGDDWEHKIKVEKMLPLDVSPAPLCIGGANACSPEHVAGAYGYADFLKAIPDPAHP